jgi:hypothetical protein
MGALLRFIILVLLVFLILRWLKSLLQPPPKPRLGDPEPPEPRPYRNGDVVDAKFTEIPPDKPTETR